MMIWTIAEWVLVYVIGGAFTAGLAAYMGRYKNLDEDEKITMMMVAIFLWPILLLLFPSFMAVKLGEKLSKKK